MLQSKVGPKEFGWRSYPRELKVYTLGSRRIVYAPAGREEDVRLYLASHGIASELAHLDPFGRLEPRAVR